uniref:Uncharacterized protein n=1 Tax=Anguilla anguilla TaxID=7936 RepID=A0A0E9U5L1_ANGAN
MSCYYILYILCIALFYFSNYYFLFVIFYLFSYF